MTSDTTMLSSSPCNSASATELIPLTPLQQGMYFTWLQDPASGIDVEQMVCTLPETIDAPRLRAAWEKITAAQPVLRSTYTPDGLTIHPALPFPWQESDWSDLSDRSCQSRLAALLEQDRLTPLSLTGGPLQRFHLIRFSPDDHCFVWTFHHILIDGRAITALLREAFTFYDLPAAPSTAGPATTFQAHNQWLAGFDHAPSTTFWQKHLAGITVSVPLVVDRLVPHPAPACQEEADHFLAPELTARLRVFAARNHITLNTVVQGAFALLLARYAGEDRVVFGATRACRHTPVPGSQDIIGFLINTLPVRVDLPSAQPLIPWLQSLRQHWLDLRPHEHTPLSFIRRACGMNASQVPFNHLLVFEKDDYTNTLRATGGPSFAHRSFHLRELTSVPLTLAVYGGDSLHLHCAFQPAIFDHATIHRLLGHMALLLEQFAAADASTVLSSFFLTTPAERQLLLHDWQPEDPQVDSETTLHGWFAEIAAKVPDRIAVTAGDATWTYGDLDRHATTIAHSLITAGVKPGDFVGICMERRAPLIAALLGILKAGAAYLPIDLAYPPERLAFMLQDAQAPVLLTERPLAAKIPENPARTLFFEDIAGLDGAPAGLTFAPSQLSTLNSQLPPTSPDSLAYIIYTSGSTGLPKGCQITHRNVVRLMKATEQWYAFNETDVWTLFHSTAFDFSVWELWGALLYGGRLVVVPWLTTRSPDDFFKLLCEERVTVLNQTPSAFRQLIQAEPLVRAAQPDLPEQSLRYVIFGGEALEMQSLKPWYDRHGDTAPRLVNMYGITETTVHVTYRPLSASDLDSGSVIGVPIPDLQLYILDPANRQPVPIGVPGEMYVGGAGLATGYLRRDELTADRFLPNHLTGQGRLYKTGDLARFVPVARPLPALSGASAKTPPNPLTPISESDPRPDNLPENKAGTDLATPSAIPTPALDIEYLGRIDHQVKIRGFRIELGEIENVLTSHPAVHEAAVLAREDRPGDKRLCAYLVIGHKSPHSTLNPQLPASLRPSPDALRALLKTRVPDYMIPAAFVFLDQFPITPNGKLDRKALPAPAADHLNFQTSNFKYPATPAEEALTTIWSAVLRLDRVSTDDNFFEVGGDSILSIQVIARAREAGLSLTPRQLFENPTITGLARVAQPLNSQLSTLNSQPSPDDLTTPFPLIPIQRWFFGQHLEDSHHWNQSFLFTLSGRLEPEVLRRALCTLTDRHPALRLRFQQNGGHWTPSIAPGETAGLLTTYSDLSDIEVRCTQLQTSLHYQNGPLLRAALFDGGEDRPGRLCLAVHHLAIDGVSWRILLEDLESILTGKPLPTPTASWPQWARQLQAWPTSPEAQKSRTYWSEGGTGVPPVPPGVPPGATTLVTYEKDTFTRTVSLTESETTALLQQAPAAYRTRINDLLLTALALAHHATESLSFLSLNLEGHGREESLSAGLPLDRTIGWFTALFPVHLTLPSTDPAEAIPSIKEQLRAIPDNGASYQLVAAADCQLSRSAAETGEAKTENSSSPLVFNYLGQFDALTSGSTLFAFARESTGPWHSPRATRAHATEINAMVIRGRLEAAFTSARPAHTPESLTAFAEAFLAALRGIITHCLATTTPRFTPSDFPLAQLTQPQLDTLLHTVARPVPALSRAPAVPNSDPIPQFPGNKSGTDLATCSNPNSHPPLNSQPATLNPPLFPEDICRLSPMQRLFHNAALTKPNAGFDQWRCRVRGPLDPEALRAAWTQVVQRHTILRSTFHHTGLPHPVMVVHPTAAPDFSLIEADGPAAIAPFLTSDASQVNDLAKAPCGRFTLLRLAPDDHFFCWTVPDLQLDGWSWPIVFSEAAAAYRALTHFKLDLADAPTPRPYRDYLAWLERRDETSSDDFWRSTLTGLQSPTPIPVDQVPGPRASRRTAEACLILSEDSATAITSAARRLGLTPGALAQAAWAALLAHTAGGRDVVHGSAFSGRPTDLPGADRIAGPFVNNLPVRSKLDPEQPAITFLRSVHGHLTDLADHQFTPLPRIQDCSAVPWRFRLFDSILVFQNYQVDDSLTRLGPDTTLSDFDGPIHTSFPLTMVITPGKTWSLLLVHQEAACSTDRAQEILTDFAALLQSFACASEAPLSQHFEPLLLRPGCAPLSPLNPQPSTLNHSPSPPRTSMEHRLATIWQRAFGLATISTADNFFDLGGHSLLMLRVHQAICQDLGRALPVVALFQYPTIQSLAAFLDPAPASSPSAAPVSPIQNRAAAARAAAAHAAASRR